MPMTNDHRRKSIQQAGATQQQIDEFVGELPLHEGSLRARGLSRPDADRARTGIRQVLADAAIIAGKYSAIAQNGGAAVPPDERENDRKFLNELFADEYMLVNPFGEQQDKARIIEAMLNGGIQYGGMGSAGFQATKQTLQVHGDTAVATGDYRLRARGRAKSLDTGEVFQQDLGGTYRITNTYVFRDNRWQAAHSQMTQVPAKQKFTLAPDA
jgi:ketosteroid isomerase-like protein